MTFSWSMYQDFLLFINRILDGTDGNLIIISIMDHNLNVPSIEEISFKLTENLIPSNALIPLRILNDSLDYTHSRLSIQMFLGEEENEAVQTPRLAQYSPSQKHSILKTTCADLIGQDTFKKPPKNFFRQRTFSHKASNLEPINRRSSINVMNLGDSLPLTNPHTPSQKVQTRLHSPHPSPYRSNRSKQNSRKKSVSGKQILTSRKVGEQELQQLHHSIKVRAVALESHDTRQKAFMRRIMQNRGKVMHPVEEISRYPQLFCRPTAIIR